LFSLISNTISVRAGSVDAMAFAQELIHAFNSGAAHAAMLKAVGFDVPYAQR
jgi:hypothetical protein